MDEEEEREITEFAEHLYNLGEFMDIKSIKGSIESFLLANHYVQLPKDKLYEQFPVKKKHRIVSPTTKPYEGE